MNAIFSRKFRTLSFCFVATVIVLLAWLSNVQAQSNNGGYEQCTKCDAQGNCQCVPCRLLG